MKIFVYIYSYEYDRVPHVYNSKNPEQFNYSIK